MNHMILYSELTRPYFFLTRFIEGLHADIQAVALIQRPPDLDTTYSLALLQEEVVDGEVALRAIVPWPPASPFASASTTAAPVAFPRPTASILTAEDRRGTDATRATSDNSKIIALRTFRRVRSLSFKSGE